ncbi:MAG: 50S ribosomal protein L11 methyltransferase, partial [Clostridiales bacterium]
GSGQHETTSLCLEALQKYWHKQARIADIGCGSGILGIAAALLGATEVQSIDNDQKAVEISQENALLNNVSALVRAKKGDLSRGLQGKFDLILANIVADAIIDLAAQVGDFLNPQGIFIASGILDIRQEDVSKAFLLNDWQVLEIMEQGQWRAFIVQKQKQK